MIIILQNAFQGVYLSFVDLAIYNKQKVSGQGTWLNDPNSTFELGRELDSLKPEVKVYYLIFSLCLCLHFVLFQTLSLKWPYESNCSETPIFSIPGYNKYTTSSCTLICKSKYLVDKCGCRDPRLLGKCFLKFVCQSLIFSTTIKVCHQGEFFKWKKTLS